MSQVPRSARRRTAVPDRRRTWRLEDHAATPPLHGVGRCREDDVVTVEDEPDRRNVRHAVLPGRRQLPRPVPSRRNAEYSWVVIVCTAERYRDTVTRSLDERFDEAVTDLARQIAELGAGGDPGCSACRGGASACSTGRWRGRSSRRSCSASSTCSRPRRQRGRARHLRDYFDGVEIPKALDVGVDVADHVPGRAIEARWPVATSREWPSSSSSARPRPKRWTVCTGCGDGPGRTVDLLGEKTIVEAEADRYAAAVEELLVALCSATGALGAGRPSRTGRHRTDPARQREHQADGARRRTSSR